MATISRLAGCVESLYLFSPKTWTQTTGLEGMVTTGSTRRMVKLLSRCLCFSEPALLVISQPMAPHKLTPSSESVTCTSFRPSPWILPLKH